MRRAENVKIRYRGKESLNVTLAKLRVCCHNAIMMRKVGVFHTEKVSNDLLKKNSTDDFRTSTLPVLVLHTKRLNN